MIEGNWTEFAETIDGKPFQVRYRISHEAMELEVLLDGGWKKRQRSVVPPVGQDQIEVFINRLTRRALDM